MASSDLTPFHSASTNTHLHRYLCRLPLASKRFIVSRSRSSRTLHPSLRVRWRVCFLQQYNKNTPIFLRHRQCLTIGLPHRFISRMVSIFPVVLPPPLNSFKLFDIISSISATRPQTYQCELESILLKSYHEINLLALLR